jgi:site-specific recombinase XerD
MRKPSLGFETVTQRKPVVAAGAQGDMARRCLPVAEWPVPDRDAWAAAHRRGGLLDDDGLAAKWAPPTSKLIADGYGRYLSFLAEAGDLDQTTSPEKRVTRARVEAYVVHLQERNHSSTVAARILQLVRAVVVMAPKTDWSWLRRIRARLRRLATPARDDRSRLMPASTVLDLGTQLMQRAEDSSGLSERRRALLFRDGLMICVLSACPIRARNLAALSIGTNLQRRGTEWWVCFSPSETKNKRPFESPLPASYTDAIERYLDHYRPQLVHRSPTPVAGEAFWISDGGRPLTAKEVGQLVSAVTKRELGCALNPHLFRKMVPTELAIRDPEHVGIAQPLLGHADYRVTQEYYNLGRAIDAARRYQSALESIRSESRAVPRGVKRADVGKQSTDLVHGNIRVSRRPSRRGIP